jgi:hypothetical protein
MWCWVSSVSSVDRERRRARGAARRCVRVRFDPPGLWAAGSCRRQMSTKHESGIDGSECKLAS